MNDLLDRFAEAWRKIMAFIEEKTEEVLDALCSVDVSDLMKAIAELDERDNARKRRDEVDLELEALDRKNAETLVRLVLRARKSRHRTDKPKARHRARNTIKTARPSPVQAGAADQMIGAALMVERKEGLSEH